MARRLRISHVIAQPVLVWDDGETLTDGPPIDPLRLSQTELVGWSEGLPDQVKRIQEQFENVTEITQSETPDETPDDIEK